MIRTITAAGVMAALVASCTVVSSSYTSEGYAPIPGSITYGGQPRTKLTRSPIGSSFPHTFTDQTGRTVEEIYVLQPDRTLRIVERHYRPFLAWDRDQ
ncbi:ABC-type Fe3+-hydroxamate transport system substrate-binding protein [Rhizobium tibeticum]|uniref:hypothetical protein n=1 Tax=Rhizobium tibeticum TaxID=501024 RepID=UPI00278257D6|nr:hypothetical protein [Rhizobium tibeticum]MDP9812232.1 ABC-type Fe3+-hydroxamate transport system substrate-binding protein [Rhizobium tibeticum]